MLTRVEGMGVRTVYLRETHTVVYRQIQMKLNETQDPTKDPSQSKENAIRSSAALFGVLLLYA